MYSEMTLEMYRSVMADVGIAQLRRELKSWLDRVRQGEEVLVTDRGQPVARLVGVDATPLLDQLQADGAISAPPMSARPTATGRARVRACGSVSDLVVEDRDRHR
jgi:prevent-host-death family protein